MIGLDEVKREFFTGRKKTAVGEKEKGEAQKRGEHIQRKEARRGGAGRSGDIYKNAEENILAFPFAGRRNACRSKLKKTV